MSRKYLRCRILTFCVIAIWCSASLAQQPAATQRQLGTVASISGNDIVLKVDSGAEAKVQATVDAKVLRLEPGQTDLKSASPAKLQDIQVGDRVLARGHMAEDGSTLTANVLVLMKGADVASKHEQERQEWQRKGVGGLVKSVSPDTGDIVITVQAMPASKTVTVHTSKQTVFRQYAPASVKFEDAKLSSIAQIKPGDQLRTRGTRSADGNELAADEVVFGSFRNVAGTVVSVNASENSVTIMDLATKKPETVKISADSQVHKLPPMVAQMLAARLRGGTGQPPSGGGSPAPAQGTNPNAAAGGEGRPGGGEGRAGGRGGDLQQMIARMPAVNLSELQKGEAVMLVATEGPGPRDLTAITMLTGVEPILTASSNGRSAASLLTPWSLGGGGGEEGGGGPQ